MAPSTTPVTCGTTELHDRVSTYAEVFCTLLPRELRNMVYTQLWTDSTDTSQELRKKAKSYFAAPEIVGEQFAVEAYIWLLENGDIGYKVPLKQLRYYINNDVNDIGVRLANCNFRCLGVSGSALDLTRIHRHFEWDEEIEYNLAPLLKLDLTRGLQLTLHIVYEFKNYFNIHLMLAASTRLKRATEMLVAKGVQVAVRFDFQQISSPKGEVEAGFRLVNYHMSANATLVKLTEKFSRSNPHVLAYPASFSIEGDVAKAMLDASAEDWGKYLYDNSGRAVAQ